MKLTQVTSYISSEGCKLGPTQRKSGMLLNPFFTSKDKDAKAINTLLLSDCSTNTEAAGVGNNDVLMCNNSIVPTVYVNKMHGGW